MGFALHTEPVVADGASPQRHLLVLHGVFGRGANWRLFARKVVRRRPDWGFVLVDLRGHGKSLGAPPPHGIDAMAADLLGVTVPEGEIAGVVGHSLGGKVALAYAALRPGELDQVWVLDSQPGLDDAQSSPTMDVMELLETLPDVWEDRRAFSRAVETRGHTRPLASWLAMNLRRQGSNYRLSMDLPVVRACLQDFFRRDLWPELARPDPRRRLHCVVAEQSFVWQLGDLERLDAVAGRNPQLCVHLLEGAGHWLQVDAPERLLELVTGELS